MHDDSTTEDEATAGELRAALAAAVRERDEARADRRSAMAEVAALVDCGGVACARPDGCALHLTRERDEARAALAGEPARIAAAVAEALADVAATTSIRAPTSARRMEVRDG